MRDTIELGVAHGTDAIKLEMICLDILLNTEGVEQEPLPQVLFHGFGESRLNFNLMFWVNLDAISSLNKLKSDIRFKLYEKLRQHNIVMAFPQRDTHLKTSGPIEIRHLFEP